MQREQAAQQSLPPLKGEVARRAGGVRLPCVNGAGAQRLRDCLPCDPIFFRRKRCRPPKELWRCPAPPQLSPLHCRSRSKSGGKMTPGRRWWSSHRVHSFRDMERRFVTLAPQKRRRWPWKQVSGSQKAAAIGRGFPLVKTVFSVRSAPRRPAPR